MGAARWLRRLACVTIATSSVAGCGHVIAGVAVTAPLPGEGECTVVSAPLTTIEPKHDSEPVMRIPQPPNWERNAMLDSDLIRFAMSDVALAANKFAPSAAVTLEDVTTKGASPEDVIAAEWDSVRAVGATDLVVTSDRPVCGFPAQTVTYKLPKMGVISARDGVGLAVVTPGVRKYAAVISVQTTEPHNPTYIADAKTVLDGFQILPEPSGNS
jgi:hypothetical protein